MSYNIVLTTAEDIVAVVDAIVAKGEGVTKNFVSKFTGIATDEQVDKAIKMSMELQLVEEDGKTSKYKIKSIIARKLVTASSDNQKAAIMRIILEQYEPYNVFKTRYEYTKSIELACSQTKILFEMDSNERDIKSTLISVATYAKALKSEGASLYSFIEEDNNETLINQVLSESAITETTLKQYWGESICSLLSQAIIFSPLSDALLKTKSNQIDTRAVIVYAANTFESFLDQYAQVKGVSLSGKNGIMQKRDALTAHLSKKHRGMIDYIGQIRNAADHGADVDENGQMWNITVETAIIYPRIVAITIRDILHRDNGIIEV